MKTNALTPELLDKMDGCWRTANCLSVGQICQRRHAATQAVKTWFIQWFGE